MKLINSLINVQILKNNLKQFWLAGVGYFIILFLAVPYVLQMSLARLANMPKGEISTYDLEYASNLLGFRYSGVCVFLVLTLSVVVAILVYRYMQSQNSVTLMHSLPATRTQLFNTGFVTGKLLLVVPPFLIAIIVSLQKIIYGWAFFSHLEIWKWFVIQVIMSLFIFAFTSLIAMITGNVVVCGAITYILISLPVIIGSVILYHFKVLLYGFVIQAPYTEFLLRITPLTRFAMIGEMHMNLVEGIIYIALTVLLYAIGIAFYKLRKSEKATESICFEVLKPVFKYGVTFCATVCMSLLCITIGNNSLVWMIFGFILGSFIGYFVSEMIVQKSVFIFGSSYKNYLVYLVVFFALFSVVKFDLTGFETRIPKLRNIESAQFAGEYYSSEYNYKTGRTTYNELTNYIDDKDTIELIMAVHESLIKNKENVETTNSINNPYVRYAEDAERTQRMYVVYKLEGGGKLVREYSFRNSDIEEALRPLYESEEYKLKKYQDLLEMPFDDFQRVRFSNDNLQTTEYAYNKNEAMMLNDILREDILNESYEDIIDESRVFSIDFEIVDKSELDALLQRGNYNKSFVPTVTVGPSIKANRSYEGVLNYLKNKGLYDRLVLSSNNIEELVIYYDDKTETEKQEIMTRIAGDIYQEKDVYMNTKYWNIESMDDIKDIYTYIEIIDPSDMDNYLLDFDTYTYFGQSGYRVAILSKPYVQDTTLPEEEQVEHVTFRTGRFRFNDVPQEILNRFPK